MVTVPTHKDMMFEVFSMEIFHYTNYEGMRNIKENGLSLSEKKIKYDTKEYTAVDSALDEYRGKYRMGKEHLTRSGAHYFIFPWDKWCACQNAVSFRVSVDTSFIDEKNLFVANNDVCGLLYDEMHQQKRAEWIDAYIMRYWNDFFPFDFYVKNKRMINSEYHRLFNMIYVPEILYFGDIPSDLLNITKVDFRQTKSPVSPLFNKYSGKIKYEWFRNPNGVHGVKHSKNVFYLADILADSIDLSERERQILAVSSVFHDIGRVHDGEDRKHGFLSWEKLQCIPEYRSITSHFCEKEIETIKCLICSHCIEDKSFPLDDIRLLQCLKDADALDRVRFGGLNPDYLRLDASQTLEFVARRIQR